MHQVSNAVRRRIDAVDVQFDVSRTIEKELLELYRGETKDNEAFKQAFDEIIQKNFSGTCNIEFVEQIFQRYEELKNRDIAYYENFVLQSLLRDIFVGQANTINGCDRGSIVCNSEAECCIEIEDNRIVRHTVKPMVQQMLPVYITTSDLVDTLGSERKLYSAQRVQSVSYMNMRLANALMLEPDMSRLTAEEYHEVEKQKNFFFDILGQIVDGNMKMENQQLVYFDNWCQQNLQLSNIASGMKIFIILKRLIDNGYLLKKPLLIIDEPESNLHPEWQLKLAEFLVLFYKYLGVKVYVNSHSPYFVCALEYYAHEEGLLDKIRFYSMEVDSETRMAVSEDVTDDLGKIYDKLAAPFNRIM